MFSNIIKVTVVINLKTGKLEYISCLEWRTTTFYDAFITKYMKVHKTETKRYKTFTPEIYDFIETAPDIKTKKEKSNFFIVYSN